MIAIQRKEFSFFAGRESIDRFLGQPIIELFAESVDKEAGLWQQFVNCSKCMVDKVVVVSCALPMLPCDFWLAATMR